MAVESQESQLITSAQHGDKLAFGELVMMYHSSVINVVYRMCGNSQVAEDAAQIAFIRAWDNLQNYRPQSGFRNWIFRIAVNAAIDMLRKERTAHNPIEDFPLHSPEPGPESLMETRETGDMVREAILSLPSSSRAVLVLRTYEELSYREIAEVLDIPVGTVMSRLNYARGKLRKILKPQMNTLEVTYG